MKVKYAAVFFGLIASIILLPSCDVRYDLVTFNSAGMMPASKTPVPKIFIDTNMSGGMLGGVAKSNKPYHILAHYMDDTFTFASAEYTKVSVTYADGTTDPGTAALKLPLKFQGAPYESHNSMAGGAVVVNKSRIIQAKFSNAIHRDEAFTLLIEGKFTKEDGTTIPFRIREKYDVSREKRTESWADFVSGC